MAGGWGPEGIEALHRAHGRPPHRPRAGIRHDDGPIPPEWAARVARERIRALWLWVALVSLAVLLANTARGVAWLAGL